MPAFCVGVALRHQLQVYRPSGLLVVTAGVLVSAACGRSVEATQPRLSSSIANGAQVRDSVGAEAQSWANACFCASVDVAEVPSEATNSPVVDILAALAEPGFAGVLDQEQMVPLPAG